MGDVDNGVDCAQGDGVYGKFLYLLLNFAAHLNLVSKNKIYLKEEKENNESLKFSLRPEC